MMAWLRRIAIAVLGRYGTRLRFPHLLLLTGMLFLVDFFVPDAIPFIDEVFLGLMALLFGIWRRRGDEVEVEAGGAGEGATARVPESATDVTTADADPRDRIAPK